MDTIDLVDLPAVGVPAELVGLCVAISAPAIQRFAHFADLLGASFGKLKRGQAHFILWRCVATRSDAERSVALCSEVPRCVAEPCGAAWRGAASRGSWFHRFGAERYRPFHRGEGGQIIRCAARYSFHAAQRRFRQSLKCQLPLDAIDRKSRLLIDVQLVHLDDVGLIAAILELVARARDPPYSQVLRDFCIVQTAQANMRLDADPDLVVIAEQFPAGMNQFGRV